MITPTTHARPNLSAPIEVERVDAPTDDVRALIGELEAALADYVDDEGVLCPIEVYAALAR